MSTGSLHGRVALVTGGSRGIGAGIARALHTAGATVVIGYRSRAADAEALCAELGERVTSVRADVCDTADSERLVATAVAAHGRLDALVLNAGVWHGARIEELAEADWKTVLDTSLGGAFRITRAALPTMRAGGFGRIVAISSAIGLIGFPGDTAYAAAKAGVVGFVRALAKEVGRDGITVNAVAPGFVETEMTAAVPAIARERMLGRASLRRAGRVEEIAAAVRFLVVDGSYVTGHTLVVDGGLSL
jgi:3-oxoacyl-[acyl-carrier protein] reductase